MGKVEVDTLTESCVECKQMDIALRPDGTLGCTKKFICKCGARVLYAELLDRFEDELFLSEGKKANLKEPAVWKKAISILEEYV